MYLKKIDAYGFKSFADRISLDFGQGITAIVGPNGSGKSNISDAIRWVLGEQSAKSLRGAKMEDVIFAGTEKRKPQGFAEVSIYLDNSTGVFPIEYSEIKVTRKVYRSGESEYTINNNVCRLRDVHELFMDTGLGRDGYSIIGQGRIDEILSTKSEDRRQIFEEAAGISKYRYRKVEAERKLQKTGDNILRLNDICGELEKRIGPLKSQSEKAKSYLNLREELKKLEVCMLVTAVKNLRLQTGQQEEVLAALEGEIKQLEQQAAMLEEKENNLYSKMREVDEEITLTRERMHSAELISMQSEGETTLLRSNIDNIKQNILRLKQEIAELTIRADADSSLKGENIHQLEALRLSRTESEQNLAGQLIKLEEYIRKTDEWNIHISRLNDEALSMIRSAEEIDAKIENIDYLKANFADKKAQLEGRLGEVKRAAEEYGKRAGEIEKELTDTEKEISSVDVRIKKSAEEITKQNQDAENLKAEYNRQNADLTFKMSRLNALSDMEKSMDGYGKAIKALLVGNVTGGIHGVLSKLITVSKEHTLAIETALGGMLQNVVVESEKDAKTAIEYLKQNSLGRVTFLPVSSVTGSRLANEKEISVMSGFVGVAADLVEYEKRYENIIKNALGRCAVFDNMDNAIKAAKHFCYKFKIVTLSGEVLFPGGSISGGSMAKSAQLLGRGAEIEELKKECALLQKGADKTDDKIEKCMEKLFQIRKAFESDRQIKNELENKKIKLLSDGESIFLMKKRETEEAVRIEGELAELIKQAEISDGGKAELFSKKAAFEKEYQAKKEKVDKEREALRRFLEEKETLSAEIMNIKISLNSFEKDEEKIRASIAAFESAALDRQKDIDAKNAEIASGEKEINEMVLRIQNKRINIDEAQNRAEEFKKSIEQMNIERAEFEREIAASKEELKIKNEKIAGKREENFKAQSRLERDKEAIDINISKLWDEYELSFTQALGYEFEIENKSAAKNKVAQLKSSIRGLGSINIDAIEEYKEVSERFEFMSSQLSDLEKAKAELEQLIVEVTKVMTAKFKEQFAIINEMFKETFSTLFGGGTAFLELTMPDRILESGIEITAQPPGKKLQSLTLLSGGEKALTAISLLFAILKVRPTPFCILDEIDAALDENNVTRFAHFVKELCGSTQFIVVTHRRGTMEAADILYGVAMQEKGVSKLLSMTLEEAK